MIIDDDDTEDARPEDLGKWMICPVCEGEGTTVNPNIDCNGLTHEDFAEDPDFREDYLSGVYNISCQACGGSGKLREGRLKELEQNAEDRVMRARENGEDPSGLRDWRYG